MKKTLYATSALVAAGLLTLGASNAFAQAAAPKAPEKMKIVIGGFMNQYIGYVDQDKPDVTAGTAYKHFDQKSDSEIYFQGSLKLDNGITASVMVQLEADASINTGQTFDESYLRLTGGFGEARLGNADAASLALSVSAPFVGINAYNGDQANWIVIPTGNQAANGSTTVGGADANRVYYISPSVAGFRIGGSYAPSSTQSEAQPNVTQTGIWDTAIQFAEKFGDVGVRASASYWRNQGSTSTATSSNSNIGVGADVTFADFTVGAGYREQDAKLGNAAGGELTAWNVGAKYNPGPYSVGLTYANGEGGSDLISGDDEARRWILGATYSIGPGVNLMSNVLYHVYEDEANVTSAENKGVAVIGGIQVSF